MGGKMSGRGVMDATMKKPAPIVAHTSHVIGLICACTSSSRSTRLR